MQVGGNTGVESCENPKSRFEINRDIPSGTGRNPSNFSAYGMAVSKNLFTESWKQVIKKGSRHLMKKILLTLGLVMSVAAARADIFNINLNATNNPVGILSGVFEVGPNLSTATGGEVGGGITYDNATSLLTINVAYGLFGFQPLTGTFTATHLHRGAAGVNGPVFINLDAGATDIHTAIGPNAGFFSGSVPLTLAQESDLFANLVYINVHSTLFPGGEIRAQFIPSTVPEPSTLAFVGIGLATLFLNRGASKKQFPISSSRVGAQSRSVAQVF